MSKDDLAALPKDLSLERIVAACLKYGADPHEVIAYAQARKTEGGSGAVIVLLKA